MSIQLASLFYIDFRQIFVNKIDQFQKGLFWARISGKDYNNNLRRLILLYKQLK